MELGRKAIDALAAPHPAAAKTRDARPTGAHTPWSEALRGYLDAGTGPSQGGEKPHVTMVVHCDALTGLLGAAAMDSGGCLSPAETRRMLCDADLVPAVLGGESELLDIGRKTRSVPM